MICTFAALVIAPAAHAQSVERAIGALQSTVDSLANDPEKGPTIPSSDLSDLRSRIDQLDGGAGSLPKKARREYAMSLEAQADLLATAKTASDPRSAEIVRDVNADLALKAHARSFGAANALRGYVNVTVRTKRENDEVRGYVVGANPVALAGAADPMFRFAALSSPTSRALPPGRYEFLLLHNNLVVSRQRADIGITSGDTVDLDLVVPAEAAPR